MTVLAAAVTVGAVVTGVVVAVVVAIILTVAAVVYRSMIAPWIAAPIAEHLERRLEDKVIAIVVGSTEVAEVIQEQVTVEMAHVTAEIARVNHRLDVDVIPRLDRMERKMGQRRAGDQ